MTFKLLALAAAWGSAQEIPFATLTQPVSSVVTQAEQTLEGRLEAEAGDRVLIRVEPFIAEEGGSASETSALVQGGLFREKVRLSPGLNLVTLQSPSGSWRATRALYLVSKTRPGRKPWGEDSPVVITYPSETATSQGRVEVKGIVTDPAIREVDIVGINAFDLLAQDAVGTSLVYRRIKVKGMRFSAMVDLTEGLTMVLAKPAGRPGSYRGIQLKSIVMDRRDPILTLEAAHRTPEGGLVVRGKLAGGIPQAVRLRIRSLVRAAGSAALSVHVSTLVVAASGDGRFEGFVDLPAGALTPPLTVQATVMDRSATRTVLSW